MRIEIKLKYLLIALAAIAACIYIIYARVDSQHNKQIDALKTKIWESERVIKRYEITVDTLTEYASEVELLLIDKNSEIMRLKDIKERLEELNIKRASVIGDLQLQVKALRDSIRPTGPGIPDNGPVTIDVEDKPALMLPASFHYEDPWAMMTTDIDTIGSGSLGFNIKNLPLNLVIGDKKTGLFQTTPSVILTTPNPYVSIDKSNVAVVDNQRPPWQYVAGGAVGATTAILLITFLVR